MNSKKNVVEKDLPNPKEFYNLYENELESDVTLLVGQDGWQERVPAHSWVLANGSDYFKALLEGPMASSSSRVHHFPDDPKGFNNLIRWLYQNKCDLQSIQSSLDTLSVAIKYLCPDLAERCIIQLASQLQTHHVIKVLCWIYCYCSSYIPPIPSAPCLEDLDIDNSDNQSQTFVPSSQDPTVSCHLLLNECFDLLDKHTDEVLNSDYLLTADPHILQMIFKRDTLNLSSELRVLKALTQWSTATCKRHHFPLTLGNRRSVLGNNLYLTRFLNFSVDEVESLMVTKKNEIINLLTEEEFSYVNAYVRGFPLPPMPETMQEHKSSMSTTRGKKEENALEKSTMVCSKRKRKLGFKKKFNLNKDEIILDLVSFLGFIFD